MVIGWGNLGAPPQPPLTGSNGPLDRRSPRSASTSRPAARRPPGADRCCSAIACDEPAAGRARARSAGPVHAWRTPSSTWRNEGMPWRGVSGKYVPP